VCHTMHQAINDVLNPVLEKVPNVLEISPSIAVKGVIRPQVTSNSLGLGLFAKVITNQVSPYQPAKFVVTPNDNFLVSVLFSDAPMNDIGFQAYEHGLLGFTVNPDTNALIYSLAKLHCDAEEEACLGLLVPGLAAKYGADANVTVQLKASRAPVFEIVQDKIKVNGGFVFDLEICPLNSTTKPPKCYRETTATVDIDAAFLIKIVDRVVYAKVEIQKENVKVVMQEAGGRNAAWEEKIRNEIPKVVGDHVNALLLKGFGLDLPFGLNLVNPYIKLNPHTIQVQTSLTWRAPGDKGKQ